MAGVALGFGAQRLVQDVLSGFFVITERQYGYGDVVRLSVPGTGAPVQGTVEDVTLRVTQLRTVNGEVVITPNGQIVQATNLSRDWARAVIDVPVPSSADVSTVTAILQDVGTAAYADDELRPLLLDAPTVMGVESIEVDTLNIRIVARTLAGQAVRGRPDDAGPDRRRAAHRGHLRRADAEHRRAQRPVVSALRRIRPTTWALAAFFVVTLVVYLLVRPPPPPRVIVIPAQTTTPSPTPSPTHTKKPTKKPTPTVTSTTPSPSLTPTQTVPPTGSPSVTGTPPPARAPP